MTTQAPCLGAGKDSQLPPLPTGHMYVCMCIYVNMRFCTWLSICNWMGRTLWESEYCVDEIRPYLQECVYVTK